LLVHRPRTVHSISHRCAITEMTITFLFRFLLNLASSLLWVERESEFAFLILFLYSHSNSIESDTRDSLMFLISSKEQISQNESMLFCIADSQQMGVMRRICTDRKVPATQIFPGFSSNQNFWGWASTPCTPASDTTGLKLASKKFHATRVDARKSRFAPNKPDPFCQKC